MSTETAIHLSRSHLLHFKILGIPAVLLPPWFVLTIRSAWHPNIMQRNGQQPTAKLAASQNK